MNQKQSLKSPKSKVAKCASTPSKVCSYLCPLILLFLKQHCPGRSRFYPSRLDCKGQVIRHLLCVALAGQLLSSCHSCAEYGVHMNFELIQCQPRELNLRCNLAPSQSKDHIILKHRRGTKQVYVLICSHLHRLRNPKIVGDHDDRFSDVSVANPPASSRQSQSPYSNAKAVLLVIMNNKKP